MYRIGEEKMIHKCNICKVTLSSQNCFNSNLASRYYICRACMRIRNKTYNVKNKTKIMQSKKRYYHENKTKIDAYSKKRYMDNLKSWEGFIPKKTNCQICSTEIYFNNNDRKKAICFDHKKQSVIKQKPGPTFWLGQHKRTNETELIWKKADFGMLCNKCNSFLPTDKRKEYIKKVVKYVYETEKGKEL